MFTVETSESSYIEPIVMSSTIGHEIPNKQVISRVMVGPDGIRSDLSVVTHNLEYDVACYSDSLVFDDDCQPIFCGRLPWAHLDNTGDDHDISTNCISDLHSEC